MLFNSLIFLLFMPCVFAGYWLLNAKYRTLFLLIASYYFYFSYNPWFLILLIGTSGFDYFLAKRISKANEEKTKKTLLTLSLVANIGVLFIFKYFVFFYNTSVSLFTNDYTILSNIIIPAGLSFYTFQSISYTIDVYRRKYKAEDTLLNFLLYVSFFPHMVAGPVVRYNSLMPQLKMVRYFKSINWESFAKLTILGYFKKMVIADNLSSIVTPIFDDVSSYSGSTLLAAGFLFVIQVYADFSGYSDIATGIAKLFNIDLSLNWRRPLLSSSLKEFWTRNHISITTWFRDYLYIGLGGNRVTHYRWLLNIFLVFLISGLWHGANLTFIAWGAMHGFMFIVELSFLKAFPKFTAPKFIGWLYLISFHTISLIAFRALNMIDLGIIYTQIFTTFKAKNLLSELTTINGKFRLVICVSLVIFLFLKELQEEFEIIKLRDQFSLKVIKPLFFIILLLSIFVLGNFNANQFIYFQF